MSSFTQIYQSLKYIYFIPYIYLFPILFYSLYIFIYIFIPYKYSREMGWRGRKQENLNVLCVPPGALLGLDGLHTLFLSLSYRRTQL